MPVRTTQEDFILRVKKIHDNKFDYSLVQYVNTNTKIKIMCNIHGIFEMSPKAHLMGQQCKYCANIQKSKNMHLDTVAFIMNAKKIHGEKYDYSSVQYINNHTVVTILCKKHGPFKQSPSNHIHRKANCPKCAERVMNTELFKQQAIQIHGDLYDYSLSEYKNSKTPIAITCKIHGTFTQTKTTHITTKCGCPKCSESKGEKEIRKYLNLKGIEYQSQFKIKIPNRQYPFSFDFYIPSLNLGIEYDGVIHYKSFNEKKYGIKQLNAMKERDAVKNDFCKTNNIKLLRIPYTKFDEITDILDRVFNVKG